MIVLSFADFFKTNFFEIFIQEYHQGVKQLGFRSGRDFVGPYLGPNCLQRLLADNKSCQQQAEIMILYL